MAVAGFGLGEGGGEGEGEGCTCEMESSPLTFGSTQLAKVDGFFLATNRRPAQAAKLMQPTAMPYDSVPPSPAVRPA